ncbi:MAG TPA: TIGR03668 family PPOX class F420-dependent oxidoreductase [Solirubrobacterales bacterium]
MRRAEARALFEPARVARLATADAEGRPHLVPICFALDGDRIVTAVDHKPKRTTGLRRLRNIEANPRASALVDAYEDDWTRLWWARADGAARAVDPGSPEHRRAVELLGERYHQYREQPPEGPAIVLSVSHWSGWRYDQ